MPTLTIGKENIEYTVRRSRRATRQRIVVTPKGVEVVAPDNYDSDRIEAFIHNRRRWIHDELETIQERMANRPWPEHFVTGAKILYRGRRMKLTVKLVPGHSFDTGYRNGFEVLAPRNMHPLDREETIKYLLELWLRRRMENDAESLVRRYSKKLGSKPKAIHIKDQKNIWGSCSKDGTINLNWRLIFMPKPILEYAVVHELCHQKHRNHSPAFWQQVKSLLPDYEIRKKWLDKHGAGFDL